MKSSTIGVWILVVILAIGIGFFAGRMMAEVPHYVQDGPGQAHQSKAVSSFVECKEAGYPITESYPRGCRDSKGTLYTEDVGNVMELQDEISIESPHPNEHISSPLTVKGEARAWYFEATFSMRLENEDGEVIAEGYVEAQDDWMVDAFVPYKGDLTFDPQRPGSTGTLYLEKANPSGLPENDTTLHIPVMF